MIEDMLMVTCTTCRNLTGSMCRKYHCAVMITLPRRCIEFLPNPGQADMRTGAQRWPNLDKQLEVTRAEDAAFNESLRGSTH